MYPLPFLVRKFHALVEGPITPEKAQIAFLYPREIVTLLHQFSEEQTHPRNRQPTYCFLVVEGH